MKTLRHIMFLASVALLFRNSLLLATELPKNVMNAMHASSDWLNSLKGKSEDHIAQILGRPSERKSWELQGKKQLLLDYKLKEVNGTLQLYFFGESIINVSLQQQSE